MCAHPYPLLPLTALLYCWLFSFNSFKGPASFSFTTFFPAPIVFVEIRLVRVPLVKPCGSGGLVLKKQQIKRSLFTRLPSLLSNASRKGVEWHVLAKPVLRLLHIWDLLAGKYFETMGFYNHIFRLNTPVLVVVVAMLVENRSSIFVPHLLPPFILHLPSPNNSILFNGSGLSLFASPNLSSSIVLIESKVLHFF